MMNDSLHVSGGIKKKKGKKKLIDEGYLSCGAPFLLYHWEDRNTNNRLTLEVLLFGAIDQSKLTLNLGEPHPRNGTQQLFLSNPLPPAWLSMKEFENNNTMTDYNTIKQHEARRRHLVELEKFFVNAAGGDGEGQILSQQEFTLPFEVENFNSQHPYEGTGYYLEKRPVVKKRKKIRRNQSQVKIVDIMNVLVVQMVAQEKCEKKKKKKTKKTFYSKACTYQASSSSSNSDDSSSSDDDDEGSTTIRGANKKKRSKKQQSSSSYHRQYTSKEPSAFAVQSSTGLSYADEMDISLGEQEVELSFETAGGGIDGNDVSL